LSAIDRTWCDDRWHPVVKAEPEKAHEGQPIADQEFGALVGQIVLRLDDQDLDVAPLGWTAR
jgi:hypothetical protein